MKKIQYLLLGILAITLSQSCTDESTFNNPVHHELTNGSFIRFENNQPNLTFEDAQNISFSDNIFDPNGNTSLYELKVNATVGGIEYEGDYFSTTTFPAKLEITSQKLADAIDIDVNDISFGDSFVFSAFATRNDGVVFNGDAPSFDEDELTDGTGNTEPTLISVAAYNNAMSFQIIVSCPFVQSEIIGEYVVVADVWADYSPGDPLTVVAGESSDTFRILTDDNPYISNAAGSWLEVTVDVATGASTALSNFGYAYNGWYTMLRQQARTGLTLSCIGYVSIDIDFLVTETSGFLGYNLTIQKP